MDFDLNEYFGDDIFIEDNHGGGDDLNLHQYVEDGKRSSS
jgi:hypothetical protein